MLKSELLKNDNLLCSVCFPQYKVELFLVYKGSSYLDYYMYLNDQLLFTGDSYRPAPAYGIESISSAIYCLSFLCVKSGDVDKDYFKDYTMEQLEWSDSFDCEQLGCILSDLSDEKGEYYQESLKEVAYKTY